MRPLWVEFPADTKTFEMDKQFMSGHALLVKPITTSGASHVTVYLPGTDVWCVAHPKCLDCLLDHLSAPLALASFLQRLFRSSGMTSMMGRPTKEAPKHRSAHPSTKYLYFSVVEPYCPVRCAFVAHRHSWAMTHTR